MTRPLCHEALKSTEDPLRWPTLPWLVWALASSLMLHGVAYASLGFTPARASSAHRTSEVEFGVAEPLPPPEPHEAPETEPPRPESEPIVARAPAPMKATPMPPAETKSDPTPTSAVAPLDLSGVTLTNAGDNGFAMRTGNGQAFAGAVGPGSVRAPAVAAPRPGMSAPPTRAALEPELVPLADLSQRPVPPALAGTLRQNYPDEARRRAVGGSARVRARLDADGVARRVQLESETFPGFGEACRRTLTGSSWSPPRDRNGRAVATEIRYTCRFEVEP
jgi:TonB family protein